MRCLCPASQLSALANPAAGIDAQDRPYTLRPMLFHVGMLAVANRILQDPTLPARADSKVGVGCVGHVLGVEELWVVSGVLSR